MRTQGPWTATLVAGNCVPQAITSEHSWDPGGKGGGSRTSACRTPDPPPHGPRPAFPHPSDSTHWPPGRRPTMTKNHRDQPCRRPACSCRQDEAKSSRCEWPRFKDKAHYHRHGSIYRGAALRRLWVRRFTCISHPSSETRLRFNAQEGQLLGPSGTPQLLGEAFRWFINPLGPSYNTLIWGWACRFFPARRVEGVSQMVHPLVLGV